MKLVLNNFRAYNNRLHETGPWTFAKEKDQSFAFSRFFSLRTRKTFSGFVQELRLQKAAKLLIENDMTITEVCYECGYNNVSNFNRQFLNHYQINPMKYRKAFLRKM